MRPFDQHVKQPITVCFVQRHVSGHGNVATITDRCVKLSDVFYKDSMPRTLNISYASIFKYLNSAICIRRLANGPWA